MENYEEQVSLMLDKIIDKTGDVKILHDFNQSILKYFYSEYFSEDYDIKNIEEDICNIGNSLLNQDKYAILHDILNNDEIELDVSIVVNDIEEYIMEG